MINLDNSLIFPLIPRINQYNYEINFEIPFANAKRRTPSRIVVAYLQAHINIYQPDAISQLNTSVLHNRGESPQYSQHSLL